MTDEEQKIRNDIELQAWNCWHDRCAVGRIGHFDREHPKWELHPDWETALTDAIGSAISRQLSKYRIGIPERRDLVQRFDVAVVVRDETNKEDKSYKDFIWGKVAESSDPPLQVIRGKLTGPTGFATRIVVEDIFREMGARKTTDKETGKAVWRFPVEYKDPVGHEGSDVDAGDNPILAIGESLKGESGLEKTNEQKIAQEECREKLAQMESLGGDDDDGFLTARGEFPCNERDSSDSEGDLADGHEDVTEGEGDLPEEEGALLEGDTLDGNAPSNNSSPRFEEDVDVFLDPPKELPPDIAKVADSINYRTGALLYASMTSISLADPQLCSFCGISKSAVYNLWNKFLKTINAQSLRGHSNEKLLQAAQDAILSHPGGEELWQRFQERIMENEQKTVDAEAKRRGY